MTDDATRPSPISLRLLAAVIDFTIVMVIVVVIAAIGDAAGAPTAGNWAALAGAAAYPIVTIARSDRTIGKRLCNLLVQRADGGRTGWARSAVRFVVTAVPLVAGTIAARAIGSDHAAVADIVQIVVSAATYAPILFDDRRRGLHDLVAGTQVICTAPALSTIAEQLAERARRDAAQER